MGRALEALMDACGRSTAERSVQAVASRQGTIGAKDIDGMTVTELLYQLCTGDGLELAGDPSRAFAAYDAATGSLKVYAASKKFVDEMFSDASVTMLAVLECAQAEGASFMVSDDKVVCVMKKVTATGKTYAEAALRALAKHQTTTGG